MSDPYADQYAQHPAYPPAGASASGAAYYAPPDSVYQNPPYDYDPHQQPYSQRDPTNPPYEYGQYGSQYDLSQTPRSFPAPVVPPPPMPQPTEYLSPVSAEYPQQALHRRGSNADYYDQHPSDPNTQTPPAAPSNNPEDAERGISSAEENERSLSGALLGGAGGYYLGHQKGHGLLGAVSGALMGNYLGDKMSESAGGNDDDDDAHSHHSSHGRRRRRHRHGSHSHSHSHSSHSGSHGHGHHHHHHHHGHRRHRSRSRHSSHGGSDGW